MLTTDSRPPRCWIGQSASLALLALLAGLGRSTAVAQPPAGDRGALGQRPSVILVMADDLGYADMGCHGNRVVKTFALDQLYKQSIRLTDFHVDPTGAPTRAALLTGRYAARTGVWHGMMGRSLLRRDERTMADLFAAAGYRTAVFGKWHLGDNYPYRAMDRGFQHALVHGGGGIGQTPDGWANTYFNPMLSLNGKWVRSGGYCTDVFFYEAIKFIEANRRQNFFVYLPANVPHSPYQVAAKYSEPYEKAGAAGSLAKYYGMITNLDENLGKLLARLDELKLANNTIFIFLTDNGTTGRGFGVEMRGGKGSAYDGGHRVPCFIRWPRKLPGGFDVDQLTAHIDVLPTLLELCEIRKPDHLIFDGKSLLPLLVKVEDWAPRTLFVQSHRIEHPQKWRESAVMTERHRLVHGTELYRIGKDPEQQNNIAADEPEEVDRLRFWYEEWYKDVSNRFDEYCEIVLGSPQQNPTVLSCFDWHGPVVPWDQRHVAARLKANGFWAVEVERTGRYRITLRERPAAAKYPLQPGAARLKIGETVLTKAMPRGVTGVTFELNLRAGSTRLQTWIAAGGSEIRGAYFVEVEHVGPWTRE